MNNRKIKTTKQLKRLLKIYNLTIVKFIDGLLKKELYIGNTNEANQEQSNYVPVSNYANVSNNVNSNSPSEIAIIARSEMDFISRCILDYPNIETGGQLFGYWSADGTPVVLYAIGPGLNANHQGAFFNQDVDYLVKVGTILNQKYGLHHIGEWHSHHQLGLAQPSGHDAYNMHSSIAKDHLGRFLLCIGNCTRTQSTLNAFNFVEGNSEYVNAKWLVKDFCGINYREVIDRQECNLITQPYTKKACHGKLNLVNNCTTDNQASSSSPFAEGYWLRNKSNAPAFMDIKSTLESKFNAKFDVKLNESDKTMSLVAELTKGYLCFSFPKHFPSDSPITFFTDKFGKKKSFRGFWNYNGDIVNSFKNYISTLQ